MLLKDKLVKRWDVLRSIHKVGRSLPDVPLSGSNILVFAAHQDDETLGIGIILARHRLAGDNIVVVFSTNGADSHWLHSKKRIQTKNEIRMNEAKAALSTIGINKENVGCLGYPDRYALRYLSELAVDVRYLILSTQPSRIYVHSIEGGHFDHDFTSYVVQKIGRSLHFTEIYEWAEYSKPYPLHPPGNPNITFPQHHPFEVKPAERIRIRPEEMKVKEAMLAAHQSQQVTDLSLQGEIIRPATPEQLEQKIYHFTALPRPRLTSILVDFEHFFKEMKL